MSVTIKTYDTIITEMTSYILANTNEITDFNIGSVIRTLIESYAMELSSETYNSLYQQLQEVYNSSRISTAAGDDLDELALLLGVTRKPGVSATGDVSFKRTTPAVANFDIASGSIVSTQPVPGEDNIRYNVTTTTTFYAAISAESHLFVDGIFDYSLNQRIINTSTAMAVTVGSTPAAFVLNADYSITKDYDGTLIDVTSIATIDNCDAITGWNITADSTPVALDTGDKKQGTGSILLGKTGTTTTEASYSKTIASPVDITGKQVCFWLYFNTTIIANISKFRLRLGSDASNYYSWDINKLNLINGWNLVILNTDDASFVGFPVSDALDYIQFATITTSTGTTFVNTNVKFDFIIVAETFDYRGDLITFINKPDTATNFLIDYKPLSVEVPVQAEIAGISHNVAEDKIIYMVTAIPQITNINNFLQFTTGAEEESDTDLRDRVLNASFVAGKATVKAIEENLKSYAYVKSASVDDMPIKTAVMETFTYTTGTNLYQLTKEVAQNNIARSVNNITTPYLYTPDVDYQFANTSEVEWLTAGTKPLNTEQFTVDYQYRWLGHIDVYVVGFNPLTVAQQAEIDDAIQNNLKAAGIWATRKSPTYLSVDVTCSIKIKTGYTFATTQDLVISALRTKLNSYEIGEYVRISQLYDTIQNMEGVDYSSIASPAADVTIAVTEVASAGVIVVNQIP